MNNSFVENRQQPRTSFSETLSSILERATKLDMAISYVQMSGWVIIDDLTNGIAAQNIRLLVTDQFGITHPEALRRAVKRGIQVRNFKGDRVFHPKVYLAYDARGRPLCAIIGSANVSESGLTSGVESGLLVTQPSVLRRVRQWFQELFTDRTETESVDGDFIDEFNVAWRRAAAKRRAARELTRRPATHELTAEDTNLLDDLFSTAKLPVATLGIDHAGNNVRNLARLLEVALRHPVLSNKERSELYLLGFTTREGALTRLGVAARRCSREAQLAVQWCRWVAKSSEHDLELLNPKIASFKRAAERFWKLRAEVRRFFFDRPRSNSARPILQAIELLCSASELVEGLSLGDFQSLSPIILRADRLPSFFQQPIYPGLCTNF